MTLLPYWVDFQEMTAICGPYPTHVTAQILFFWEPSFRGGPSASRSNGVEVKGVTHPHGNLVLPSCSLSPIATPALALSKDGLVSLPSDSLMATYLSSDAFLFVCQKEKKSKGDGFRECTAIADNEHRSEYVWPYALIHGKLNSSLIMLSGEAVGD